MSNTVTTTTYQFTRPEEIPIKPYIQGEALLEITASDLVHLEQFLVAFKDTINLTPIQNYHLQMMHGKYTGLYNRLHKRQGLMANTYHLKAKHEQLVNAVNEALLTMQERDVTTEEICAILEQGLK